MGPPALRAELEFAAADRPLERNGTVIRVLRPELTERLFVAARLLLRREGASDTQNGEEGPEPKHPQLVWGRTA